MKHTILSNMDVPDAEDLEADWDAERCNLNIPLDGRVICIADVGRWNGRRWGYRLLGNNVNSIFDALQGDLYEVYRDRYNNIRCVDVHHDGRNYYTFREIKPEYLHRDDFLWKFVSDDENVRARAIRRYTKTLGNYVNNVYGWR